VYLKINNILKRASPSIGDRTFQARMDLESLTLYLAMNHPVAVKIHAQINKVRGKDMVGYLIITRYLQKQSVPHSWELAERETKIGSSGPIDRAMPQALNTQPFASSRWLLKRTLIPLTTIRYHSINEIGYKIKH
jgi:hypothetical protein